MGRGNAVEYRPPKGAYALAAKNMGKSRQEVWRGYRDGVERFLVAVANAAIQIEEQKAAQRRQYREAMSLAEKISEDFS